MTPEADKQAGKVSRLRYQSMVHTVGGLLLAPMASHSMLAAVVAALCMLRACQIEGRYTQAWVQWATMALKEWAGLRGDGDSTLKDLVIVGTQDTLSNLMNMRRGVCGWRLIPVGIAWVPGPAGQMIAIAMMFGMLLAEHTLFQIASNQYRRAVESIKGVQGQVRVGL